MKTTPTIFFLLFSLATLPAQPPGQVPQGLAPSDWAGIRAAYEAARHEIRPVEGERGAWQAVNPGQQWKTRFDGRGFLTVPNGGASPAPWSWGLALKSYGRAGTQNPVQRAEVTTEDGRIVYHWDGILSEWFVNDPRGLEHGFTIAKRPADGQGPLVLEVAVRGTLRPDVAPDGQRVSFLDKEGSAVLDYAGLKVWDADGKVLASRLESAGGETLRFQIEEDGARYPLMIDPVANRQAYLKASNTGADDRFGYAVAVSGTTVVVGAYQEDSNATTINPGAAAEANNTASSAGAAYVFVYNGATWSKQAYLKPSNANASDQFGFSVAISGDTIVVGANGEASNSASTPTNNSAANAGAAYVFVRGGTAWTQQKYLKASNIDADDQFGSSVAISGDTIVVGAPQEDGGATGINGAPNNSVMNAGAAYVFLRSGTAWSQQAYVKAFNTGATDYFGRSVSVSGDTIAIGASSEAGNGTGVNPGAAAEANNSAAGAGAVYVYARSGSAWSRQAYVKASNTEAGDTFGWAVSIDGDILGVGAYQEDSDATGVNGNGASNAAGNSGAAYLFARTGTTWNQQAYVKASNTAASDNFGLSISVSGSSAIIGARNEDSDGIGINPGVNAQADNSAANAGAAYVFARSGTAWSQQAYLKASNTGSGDSFGSVAISGDLAIVGAYNEGSNATGVNPGASAEANNSATGAGAAYVFVRNGGIWGASQEAYLKASNTEASDYFGRSIAVSENTVVIGAPGEDSSGTGQGDNSSNSAGAAYVFVYNGTTWSQQAYLKASNAGADDKFGTSVALSGDTIVVGANWEDSSATGVNSGSTGEADNSSPNSGAAYVFVRSGAAWIQQAYLKASNTGEANGFGSSISISGDTVIIGAGGESNGSGAAYIFVRNEIGVWSQQAYLKASNAESGDNFGRVGISGDTAVVGAPQEDSNAVGVDGNENNNSASFSGAAYVFVRSGTSWIQQAYLKPTNTGAQDIFGFDVAISGNTIVVGAPQEGSNATGINGNGSNNSSFWSGAAYIFTCDENGAWSQQAYLKASNTSPYCNFGVSVAVSGNTAVVGAINEPSSATGINGDQTNNGTYSGAAYVFTRSGSTWSQQAYLKASNTSVGEEFGWRVAISKNTIVVGDDGEDSNATGINGNQIDNSATGAGAAYIFTGLGAPYYLQLVFDNISIAYPNSFFSGNLNIALEIPDTVPGPYYAISELSLGSGWTLKSANLNMESQKIESMWLKYAAGGNDIGFVINYPGVLIFPKVEGSLPFPGPQTLSVDPNSINTGVDLMYDESVNLDTIYGPSDTGPDTLRTSSGNIRMELGE